jgi:hypothetical protein
MRPSASLLLLLAGLSFSSPALAQPIEVEPVPAPPVMVPAPAPVPPPPPGYVAIACPPGSTDRACLKPLLETNPQYVAARSRRNSGIVLTSVGSGIGIVALAAAWASYAAREGTCWSYSGCHNSYTGEKIAAGLGGGLVIVALAVGIPMMVSGSREMRFVRNQYLNPMPVPVVSVGAQHATFGAAWRF